MDHYCHFHPNSPAKWRCIPCNQYYDNACLPQCDEKRQLGHCPACQKDLTFLPAEALPAPRIFSAKAIFLACIHPYSLGLILISVGLSAWATLLTSHNTLILFLCLIISLCLPLHFFRAFTYFKHLHQQTRVRKTTKRQVPAPQTVSSLSITISLQLTLVSSIILLLPVYSFYTVHWLLGLLLLILGGLCFPWLIMFSLHSHENEHSIAFSKLFKALQPFLMKLGLCSVSLLWLSLIVGELAGYFDAHVISICITSVVATLSTLIITHLSSKAFVIAEQRLILKQIKLAGRKKPTQKNTFNEPQKASHVDTEIDQALKTGQYETVVALLEASLKKHPHANLRIQQLFLLLNELHDLEKLSRYAELFLRWMVTRNRTKEASQFIYRLRKYKPDFLLHDLTLMNALAKRFLRAKKYALVLWLADDAKVRFQPSEALAFLYLAASQALVTHFKDLEKAEEYLLFILQHCSECPSAETAKALLIHLQNNQKQQHNLRT